MARKKELYAQTTFKIPGRPDFVTCGPLEAFKEQPTHIHVVTKRHIAAPYIKSEEIAVVMLQGGGECFNEHCWINTLALDFYTKRITSKAVHKLHEVGTKNFMAKRPKLFADLSPTSR